MQPASECAAPMSVATLADMYYQQSTAAFTESVRQVLVTCGVSGKVKTRYAVLFFTAKPTAGGKDGIVHLLYDGVNGQLLNRPTLLGVGEVTWIYLSDEKSDKLVVQLSSVASDNPILGQLGKLASTIVPKFHASAEQPPPALPQTFPIFISISSTTELPLKRGTITVTDFVGRDKTQIDGTATFNNTPRTWMTVNAGAGVFAGKTVGAQQAKIDSKTYVSDPLARGATFAGVTFHAPYDGSQPKPDRAERIGFVVAAVLTPALGIYVGPSCGWRGLSLTAGWAEMWVNVPPKPKQINDPVEGQEKLGTGRTGRFLIAVSYAFGS